MKLQEILDFINKDQNLDIVYDLIIKKDIHMFKYLDRKEYKKFIYDIEQEAIETYERTMK